MKSQHQIQELHSYFKYLVDHPTPSTVPEYTSADDERSRLALDILSWVLDQPCNMETHFAKIKASFNHEKAKHN